MILMENASKTVFFNAARQKKKKYKTAFGKIKENERTFLDKCGILILWQYALSLGKKCLPKKRDKK
ncbi:MAG: hypothetical protein IKI88_05430 [Anaerotignum sp.]|nr:hypothetical protein [Anaerotignum sp.]